MKTCTVCLINKSLDCFSKRRASKDGLQPLCKDCSADYQKKYRHTNRDKLNKNRKEYYKENREDILEYASNYYIRNKERIRGYNKEYRDRNEEALKAKQKEYRRANRHRLYLADKRYREENKKKVADRIRKWMSDNPDKKRAANARRRARERNAEGTYTDSDVSKIMNLQRSRCAMCAANVKDGYHVDHIVALVNGGTNWPENLQILCPPCNLSKRDKCPIEFANSRGLLL